MNDYSVHVLDALEQIMWDLPDDKIADATNAQAHMTAGYCPDDYYHDSNQGEQISSTHL